MTSINGLPSARAANSDLEFLEQLQPFFGKVHADMKEDVPYLTLAREGDLGVLLSHVSPALLASLVAED